MVWEITPQNQSVKDRDISLKNFKLFWSLQQVFGQIAEHKKHVAVDELDSILKDNKEALILDLGAGTGIIGQMVIYT